MSWGSLRPNQIATLVTAYNENPKDPLLITTANNLGISLSTLQRRCREINQYKEIFEHFPSETEITVDSGDLVDVPAVPATHLTDIQQIDKSTDQLDWLSWLSTRYVSDPILSVMHLCDMHEPFGDPLARDLALQVVKQVQPDLIFVGSDYWDFYLLSSFGVDGDVSSSLEGDDELDMLENSWNPFIHELKGVCPTSKLVYIFGNHERRLLRHLQNDAPNLRRRIYRDYVDIVRSGSGVWYIGAVDHARIGPLRVEHGVRHNDHVAKSRLDDEGYQVSIMMGHVHRLNYYAKMGADFAVSAVSSGCLCDTTPHYMNKGQTSRAGRKWQQGTAIATVDLRGGFVQFENLLFRDHQTLLRGKYLQSTRHEESLQSLAG